MQTQLFGSDIECTLTPGPVHAGCIMPAHLDIDDLIVRMISFKLPKATLLLMDIYELGVEWVKRDEYKYMYIITQQLAVDLKT